MQWMGISARPQKRGKWNASWGVGSLVAIVFGLVEEEVRGQFLVLVTGKIGLDDLVAGEAETAELESSMSA
jgi:hypothetical protein